MREYLAQNSVPYVFVDVRKAPLSRERTLALVREHRRALAKVGGKVQELDPVTATDAEIAKLFLGRQGAMRAPVVSANGVIFAGFDESTLRALVG